MDQQSDNCEICCDRAGFWRVEFKEILEARERHPSFWNISLLHVMHMTPLLTVIWDLKEKKLDC